jgi:hypothetical protein
MEELQLTDGNPEIQAEGIAELIIAQFKVKEFLSKTAVSGH